MYGIISPLAMMLNIVCRELGYHVMLFYDSMHYYIVGNFEGKTLRSD